MFLADESGSISHYEFDPMIKFMADLVGDLNIGKDEIRVGLRLFHSHTRLHIALEDFSKDVENMIRNVKFYFILIALSNWFKVDRNSGGTDTAQGLRKVMEEDFTEENGMRKDSRKILVVMTDGQSNDHKATINQVN